MSVIFLWDTNVISEINKKLQNRFVVDKMSNYKQEVATATPVIHELLFGALRLPIESKKRAYLLKYIAEIPLTMPVLDYNLKSAHYHAEQRFRLSKIGKPPAFVDGQIASIAFINHLTLVTNNVKDFEGFDGLMIENWFLDADDA